MVKDYDCSIHYHPGKANVVIDSLSKKAPRMRGKAKEQPNDNVEMMVATIRIHSNIVKQIKEKYQQDPQYEQMRQRGLSEEKEHWELSDIGVLRHKKRIWVLKSLQR